MLVSYTQASAERGQRQRSTAKRPGSSRSGSTLRTTSIQKRVKGLQQQAINQQRDASPSFRPNITKKRAPQTGGLAANAMMPLGSQFMSGATLRKKLKKSSRSPAKRSAYQTYEGQRTIQDMRVPSIEVSHVYTPKQEDVDEKFKEANIEIKESLKHFKNTAEIVGLGSLRSQLQNSAHTADSILHMAQSQEFQDLIRQSQILDQKVDQIKSASSRGTINIKVKTSSPKSRKTSTRKIRQQTEDESVHSKQDQMQQVLHKDKIRVQQLEIEQLRTRVEMVRSNLQHEIQMLASEKEQAHNLLRKRNETELKLQSEILEKNSIIENLTKKLKESTVIILQINQKNQQLSKNYSLKITEKVKLKTEEMKAKENERIEKLNAANKDKLHELQEEIKLMTARLKEADNIKALYKDTKQRLQDLQDSASKVYEQNEIITRQTESMTQIQTVNQQLQNQVKQLNEALSAKDTQVDLITRQKDEIADKQKKQAAAAQTEFDQIIQSIKKQSQQLIEQKNNEINELMSRLNEQEVFNQTVNAQALSNTEQELEVAHNLKREAEDRSEALQQKVSELESRIIELSQLNQNEKLKNTELLETHLQVTQLSKANQDLQTRIDDLLQDLTISHKELEFSKIEQEQLKQVISNQTSRIAALEQIDMQKNIQITELKHSQADLIEQLETMKVNIFSRRTSIESSDQQVDNRLLLIEENSKQRQELKDLQKQITMLQQELQAMESVQADKGEAMRAGLESENRRLQESVHAVSLKLKEAQGEVVEFKAQLEKAELKLRQDQMMHNEESKSQLVLMEQQKEEMARLAREISTHTKSNDDLSQQIQKYKVNETEIQKRAKEEFGKTVEQLQQNVNSMTQELATKSFEYNLKLKELEKCKQKIKEHEDYINEMENMAIEAHTEHMNEVDTLEEKIKELMEGRGEIAVGGQSTEDIKQLQLELESAKANLVEKEIQIAKLKQEKIELQKLIRAMKGNLKQLRSVFINQIQNGVQVQKKYLSLCRSQDTINWDDSQILTEQKAEENHSEEEVQKSHSLEVTQEFKTFEAEKELVQNAVIEITAGQNENNKGLKDQYQTLQEKLKAKQAKIDELASQLQQLSVSRSSELESLQKQLADSSAQISKLKQDHQKQVEQITMQLITERQATENMKSSSQKSLKSQDSKEFEQKIKKLEYQNKQHEQNLDSFQKVLSEETLKRQESQNKFQQKEEDNKELIEDIKQLTETLEAKEDELMKNYQQYLKDLKQKDTEIADLKRNIQELLLEMSQMGSSAGQSSQISEKQTLEIQQLKQQISQLEHQSRNQISEFEAMQLEKEDIIFDKDIEIKQMQKQLKNKDLEILELQNKIENLMMNPANQVNDLEFLEQQSNSGFVQNKRHSMLSGSKQEFQFLHNQNDFRKSQFRESLIEASPFKQAQRQSTQEDQDLNIYGNEDRSESSENDQVNELYDGYTPLNQLINQDINRDFGDSFGVKRVQTLNQNKLQASMKQLEMVPSSASLLNKNVLESKVYQDLEAHTKKLKVDLEELSAINRNLLQQIEKITAEKNAAISDTVSVVSVQEELKSTAAQLASRKEEVSKLKDRLKLIESEKETKDMMIKQFNIEMENYAEEKLMYEEKIAILEETVVQLTGQLAVVIDDGNQKTINARKEELRKIKEEEERLKPKQMPSFLMPPPEAISKKSSDKGASKTAQKPRQSRNAIILDEDVRSDNSKSIQLQSKSQPRKKPTMAMF